MGIPHTPPFWFTFGFYFPTGTGDRKISSAWFSMWWFCPLFYPFLLAFFIWDSGDSGHSLPSSSKCVPTPCGAGSLQAGRQAFLPLLLLPSSPFAAGPAACLPASPPSPSLYLLLPYSPATIVPATCLPMLHLGLHIPQWFGFAHTHMPCPCTLPHACFPPCLYLSPPLQCTCLPPPFSATAAYCMACLPIPACLCLPVPCLSLTTPCLPTYLPALPHAWVGSLSALFNFFSSVW